MEVSYSRESDDRQLLRVLTGINQKVLQYKRWVNKNEINDCDPFIIAVNTGMVTDGDFTFDYSYGARSVFGIGESVISVSIYPTEAKKPESKPSVFIKSKTAAVKINGATVDSNLFLDPRHKFVSAIIFSPHHIANSFARGGSDVELILNPFAVNPIPKDFLKFGKVTIFESEEENISYRIKTEVIESKFRGHTT